MHNTEAELRSELLRRAEERFGKDRAAKLITDLEQLSSELYLLSNFELEPTDEPA